MTGRIWLLISVLIGMTLLAKGLYIPIKAEVAQWLLEDAWHRRTEGESVARPWAWADTYPVARLRQPRLGIDQIVLQGTSGRVLAFGPGHVNASAPVGSASNVVFSGHRDTHFKWLKNLRQGDALIMDLPDGREMKYAVVRQAVHEEDETYLLSPDAYQGLRLMTCYPFGATIPGGSQRYLVDAIMM